MLRESLGLGGILVIEDLRLDRLHRFTRIPLEVELRNHTITILQDITKFTVFTCCAASLLVNACLV